MYPWNLEETLEIAPLKPGYAFAREVSNLFRSCNKLIVHIHLKRLERRRKVNHTYLFLSKEYCV